MVQFRRVLPAALIALLLTGGCMSPSVVRNESGTTYGDIYVSYPRIAGRERLVSDRLEQEQWLAGQLSRVNESELGFDGSTELRNLLYTSAQVKAQFDPAFRAYSEQSNQASQAARANAAAEAAARQVRQAGLEQIATKLNRGDLTAEQANTEMAKLGVTLQPLPVGAAASAPAFPTLGSPTGALEKSFPGRALLDATTASSLAPPSGASAATTSLQGSPIDRFRDLVNIREEIRTARIENALDDAHDIAQNTLYRLTFDATIRPERDTSAFAIVEMTASVALDIPIEVANRIREAYQAEARTRVETFLTAVRQKLDGKECELQQEFRLAIDCAIGDLSARDQVYISSAFARLNLRPKPIQRDVGNRISLESIQLIRTLLVDGEAQRLERSLAGCYLTIARGARSAQPFFFRDYIALDNDLLISFAPVGIDDPEFTLTRQDLGCKTYSSMGDLAGSLTDKLYEASHIKTYAITPRESVQRLSEVAGNRSAREILLGVSAIAGSAGIGAALQQLKASDALYQAIRRQPVVVGLGNMSESDHRRASFGWIIGPQFQLSDSGDSARFRHLPKQQPISATISLPAWAGAVFLCTQRYWINDAGDRVTAPAKSTPADVVAVDKQRGLTCGDGSQALRVTLPQKTSTLLQAATVFDTQGRLPRTGVQQRLQLVEGEPAEILLTGENLWRGTEVFIGSQKADRVSLTPDMGGIHASFNRVSRPNGSVLRDGRADIVVFTSEGKAIAGTAVIFMAESLSAVASGSFARRIVAGEETSFDLSSKIVGYSVAEVFIGDPLNEAFSAKVSEVKVALDGRRVSFTLAVAALNGVKSGQLVNVSLKVKRTPSGSLIDIPVARNIVYFSDPKDARVGAAIAGKVLPLNLTLTFPSSVLEGFGGLASRRVGIAAMASTPSGERELLASTCQLSGNSCKVKVSASSEVAKEIALLKGSWRLILRFADSDVPELEPAAVDISK